MDHSTVSAQYPLARGVEVHPSDSDITHRVRIMIANENKVNPHFPCKYTYMEWDSTKIVLVEFPLVNPL